MIFTPTGQPGAFVIDLERFQDERGFFARSWCQKEAREHGIDVQFVQCNVSHNRHRGILRGMHYQYPNWEDKLVRVTRGAILDVIVDIRPDSPTFRQHYAVELSHENHRMLFVPKGFAHGFTTLQDDTDIFYQMSVDYVADQAQGFRYDDPQFAIPWPEGNKLLSARDRDLPFFSP
jgi:dTDP-4-dehydrorhamnose 3,5-epimerase